MCHAFLPESLFEMADPCLHKITQLRQAKSVAASFAASHNTKGVKHETDSHD
jgi:hypothetical protein